MFEKIKVFDAGAVAIAGIIAFFLVFLGWIIAGQILRPMLFPTPKEALDPAYAATYRLIPTLIGLAVIYGPFLAAGWWAWNKPVMLMVEKSGEWVVRNPFYVSRLRIPPEQPRQLEAELHQEYYEDSNKDYYYSGILHLQMPSKPGITLRITCDERPDGRPDFFTKFGYAETLTLSAGPHGGQMTPLHTWSASGPVFVAEQAPVATGSAPD